MNEKAKLAQIKIIMIYLFIGIFNYILHNKISISIDNATENQNDILFYYIFSCEFFLLFFKLVGKFFKLTINLMSINLGKVWEKRSIVFNILGLFQYIAQLVFEIQFCYILFKRNYIPFVYYFDIILNLYHLFKLINKIYENYRISRYITDLVDYDYNKEVKNIEKEKDKKDKIIVCNICLTNIDKGKYLNCGHVFHLKCIK